MCSQFVHTCSSLSANLGGSLRANEGVLVLLPSKVRVNVSKRSLLRLVSHCTVDPVSVVLAFARAAGIDWAAPNCVGLLLYKFKDAAIISVFEWQTKSLKWGLRGDTLPGVDYVKVVSRYVEVFVDACMS